MHWNTECFEVQFSNGPETKRLPFCQSLENQKLLENSTNPTIQTPKEFSILAPTVC